MSRTGANEWVAQWPRPILERAPEWTALYSVAWEQARASVRECPDLPQSPYLWPGVWAHSIWIWDTCFMALYGRYAPDALPAIESLRNFYVPLHDGWTGPYPRNIQHPDNPPLFAWVEHDHFKFTHDVDHIRKLLIEDCYLQRHFDWFDRVEPGWRFESATERRFSSLVRLKKMEHGYLWHGLPSGMDNTPRGRGAAHDILWVDAIAQQGLAALYISRLAEAIGEAALSVEWRGRYDRIRQSVNTYYWDDEDGFYYDIDHVTRAFCKVKTPASYWPLLAEMATPEQARRMLGHALDAGTFGGERPWPTLARTDPDYAEAAQDGRYWRGGVWAPTTYMAIKALEKYGFFEEATTLAERALGHIERTYRAVEPASLWEALSPTRDHPADRPHGKPGPVRPYVGWSSLPPIALLIENVLGFHDVDAAANRVHWRWRPQGRHGIEQLRFGPVVTDILAEADGQVRVTSNRPYTLVINGTSHAVQAGATLLNLDGASASAAAAKADAPLLKNGR